MGRLIFISCMLLFSTGAAHADVESDIRAACPPCAPDDVEKIRNCAQTINLKCFGVPTKFTDCKAILSKPEFGGYGVAIGGEEDRTRRQKIIDAVNTPGLQGTDVVAIVQPFNDEGEQLGNVTSKVYYLARKEAALKSASMASANSNRAQVTTTAPWTLPAEFIAERRKIFADLARQADATARKVASYSGASTAPAAARESVQIVQESMGRLKSFYKNTLTQDVATSGQVERARANVESNNQGLSSAVVPLASLAVPLSQHADSASSGIIYSNEKNSEKEFNTALEATSTDEAQYDAAGILSASSQDLAITTDVAATEVANTEPAQEEKETALQAKLKDRLAEIKKKGIQNSLLDSATLGSSLRQSEEQVEPVSGKLSTMYGSSGRSNSKGATKKNKDSLSDIVKTLLGEPQDRGPASLSEKRGYLSVPGPDSDSLFLRIRNRTRQVMGGL